MAWARTETYGTASGSCQDWVRAIPEELHFPISFENFSGQISATVDYGATPEISIKGQCKTDCNAPVIKSLKKVFTYMTYASDGGRVGRETGPGSETWIPLSSLPPKMVDAAIALEDPGFMYHKGFIAQAYSNSLKDNLKVGKFLRGGSTISMQLAKNLWLTREKTFGRKVQEFFLAQALESCFDKSKIMELYLNVVQFGPDLYGVGPAARHYFKVSPAELTLEQAFWLASILPHPGTVKGPPAESQLRGIRSLIRRLARNGQADELSDEEVPINSDVEWGN